MKYFYYIIFLSLAFSGYVVNESESKVIYYGSHPLHDWSGESKSIKLNTECQYEDMKACNIEFEIPLLSFYSGNDNRDSNMLHYLNAYNHPNVIMNFDNFIISDYFDNLIVSDLFLNGIKKTYEIPLNISLVSETAYQVESIFSISLNDFKVKLPSLLFLSIDDEIKIEVKLLIEI
mgnify:CR=1 FL=1